MSTPMSNDGQPSTSDDSVTDLISAVADDPVIRQLAIGFIESCFASAQQMLADGDINTRMKVLSSFLPSIIRDATSRNKSTDSMGQVAENMRDLMSSVLSDEEG